jgi:hypothetical protein
MFLQFLDMKHFVCSIKLLTPHFLGKAVQSQSNFEYFSSLSQFKLSCNLPESKYSSASVGRLFGLGESSDFTRLDGRTWRLIAVNISTGEIQLIGNESFPFYQSGGFAGTSPPNYDHLLHVNTIVAVVTVNPVDHRLHLLQSTLDASVTCSTLVTLDSVSGAMLSTVKIRIPSGTGFSPTLGCLSPTPASNLVVDISSGNVYVMWYYKPSNGPGTQFILRIDWQSGASSVAGKPDNMYIMNSVRAFDPINQLYYFQGTRTTHSAHRAAPPVASPAIALFRVDRPIPRTARRRSRASVRGRSRAPRDGAQAPWRTSCLDSTASTCGAVRSGRIRCCSGTSSTWPSTSAPAPWRPSRAPPPPAWSSAPPARCCATSSPAPSTASRAKSAASRPRPQSTTSF